MIDCDATFRDAETLHFGCWLPYNFETGELDHLGDLINLPTYSSVYPVVEREVRHARTYIAWEEGVTHVSL